MHILRQAAADPWREGATHHLPDGAKRHGGTGICRRGCFTAGIEVLVLYLVWDGNHRGWTEPQEGNLIGLVATSAAKDYVRNCISMEHTLLATAQAFSGVCALGHPCFCFGAFFIWIFLKFSVFLSNQYAVNSQLVNDVFHLADQKLTMWF